LPHQQGTCILSFFALFRQMIRLLGRRALDRRFLCFSRKTGIKKLTSLIIML